MTMNAYLAAVCCDSQDVNPLFNLLGARLTSVEKGKATITLPLSHCLAQGAGVVAGGILATLADEAMAHAVISFLGDAKKTVTTEMNIRYLRASDPDREGVFISTATVIKPGRSIMTAEAEIHDDQGRLLATAGGSFFVIDESRRKNA